MPYQKLSEYQAKKLFYDYIRSEKYIDYCSLNNLNKLNELNNMPDSKNNLVVKIDDGSKRRMKRGLVKINQNMKQINEWILSNKDYHNNYVIEESVNVVKEYYVMIRLTNDCNEIIINKNGGILLDNPEKDGIILKLPLTKSSINIHNINNTTFDLIGIDDNIRDDFIKILDKLYRFYLHLHMTFMEVNPLGLITNNNQLSFEPLDFAILRDTCSDYLLDEKSLQILNMKYFNNDSSNQAERNIKELDGRTGSSLKFTLINPNGSIWTLIAGGGASVIYTDAIINCGYGSELANYGEYSGNPQEDLVKEYCLNVFKEIVKVKKDKILFIGGGIANFTDVSVTFNGIIGAIDEIIKLDDSFRSIKIYIRRGGPNYKEGLTKISKILTKHKIEHYVSGPESPITQCVKTALGQLTSSSVLKQLSESSRIYDEKINLDDILKSQLLKLLDNMEKKKNHIFTKDTKSILIGLNQKTAQRMLDFDYVSNRSEPSIVAIIEPRQNTKIKMEQLFFGNKSVLIPVYRKYEDCVQRHKFDTAINFMSFRSAYDSSIQLINSSNVKTLIIIAEGMPEHLTLKLKQYADSRNVRIIGPATVGGIKAGEFRIGDTGGSLENIIECKLHKQNGSVGFVTRSGGLLNELCWIIGHRTDGVNQGISIGGDRWPCSQFIEYIMQYENDEKVKMIVLLGEIGGIQELLVGQAKKMGLIKKPIVGWCMGTSADYLAKIKGDGIQFGHAGASASVEYESALFKNYYMKQSGINVPNTFEEIGDLIEQIYLTYGKPSTISQNIEPKLIDKNRTAPTFYSSISDEKGDELKYNGQMVSEITKQNNGIGKTIGHLWLKKDIPEWLAKYFELILVMTADHGGMVSGAHNTIVASRAGKDLISSLCSGLLTIGDYFGGALNKAGQQFYEAMYVKKYTPKEFVDQMKNKGELISGIGHKVKSIDNPDSRVKLLKEYVMNNFTHKETVMYGLEVEKITTQKKNNLILNVDGFIALSLIDAFKTVLSEDETLEIIEDGLMNGFFVLGRTIGFIGHWYDQKRLKQGLFRLPDKDIEYLK